LAPPNDSGIASLLVIIPMNLSENFPSSAVSFPLQVVLDCAQVVFITRKRKGLCFYCRTALSAVLKTGKHHVQEVRLSARANMQPPEIPPFHDALETFTDAVE